jgi:hypothetical protein
MASQPRRPTVNINTKVIIIRVNTFLYRTCGSLTSVFILLHFLVDAYIECLTFIPKIVEQMQPEVLGIATCIEIISGEKNNKSLGNS